MTRFLKNILQKLNEVKPGRLELYVFTFYCLLLISTTIMHEPYFDEAQAWMIARSASLWDVIFTIPHYEGHPPLWHLILVPIAKTGIPFEVGLKIINTAIAMSAVGILVFKSPFPRILKLSLPFTYFIFYQYGVISRPYSLMMLAFMLMAFFYDQKDNKPMPYIASLILMSASSAYGIIISGTLSVIWMIRIFIESRKSVLSTLKDKRILYLSIYIILTLVTIGLIFPANDAYAMNFSEESNTFGFRLFYNLIIMPVESLFFQSYNLNQPLQFIDFPLISVISGAYLGVLLNTLIVVMAYRFKTLKLLIPFLFFAFFGAVVYFDKHHIGIAFLYLLFFSWITLEKAEIKDPIQFRQFPTVHIPIITKRLLIIACYIFIVFALTASVYWSSKAIINEGYKSYGFGRELSEFIIDNNLSGLNIMASWEKTTSDNSKSTNFDTGFSITAVTVLPYFNENIIFSLNQGNYDEAFVSHRIIEEIEGVKNQEFLESQSYPDILIGTCQLSVLYPESKISITDYSPIFKITEAHIWKDKVYEAWDYLYIRNELLDQYGLKAIQYVPYLGSK